MEDKHLDILLELNRSVGSLHAKFDSVTESLEEHKTEDDKAHARIASLEETRSGARGGWAVLVVAVAVVSSLVTLLAHAWTGK